MEEAEYTQWMARINDLTDAQRIKTSTVLTGQPGKGSAGEFGDKERLLLQQLLTLRTITSDPRKPVDPKNEQEEQEEPVVSMPDLWRLLPEGFQPYKWQGECLTKWFDHGCQGTVKVATGGGKTLFALAAAQELQNSRVRDLRLAIVVPTIVLMNQWYEELSESNIPLAHIGRLGGEHTDPTDPNIQILISVINSARDKLPTLVKRWGWSDRLLLVVDECHRANAFQNRKIFESRPKHTLGLSATPEVGDEDTGVTADEAYAQSPVGEGVGPIIYNFSLEDSLRAGLLTEFEVHHVGVSLAPDETSKHESMGKEISDLRKELKISYQNRKSRGRQDFFAWCQVVSQGGSERSDDARRFLSLTRERKSLLYRAESRFGLTLKILSAAMGESDRRVIVFHEEIDEINKVFCTARETGAPVVLEHSKLPKKLREENIELFRRGVARAIISAKSLIEGFNVPSADVGIIAASSGSVRQRIQSLGRMLRKKPDVKKAVIFVLYAKNTSDEKIYDEADWEKIIGATNRYFVQMPDSDTGPCGGALPDVLSTFTETGVPPRPYRPRCSEIDPTDLVVGEEYPGQTRGQDLKVDQMENLRALGGGLVRVPKKVINMIRGINGFGRATRTPCGHLISRRTSDSDGIWIFLGQVDEPAEPPSAEVEKLYLKQRRGRLEIVRKLKGGDSVFARDTDKAKSREAGETRDVLLRWVGRVRADHAVEIRHLYWEGENRFYVEVHGRRVRCGEALGGLEFPPSRGVVDST